MLRDNKIRRFNTRRSAFTLLEVMIALAIGALVGGALATTLLYGVRSMAALNNYIALDRSGRNSLDTLMTDIRAATEVTSTTPSGTYANLSSVSFVDLDGTFLTYTFDSTARTLERTQNGLTQMLLTNCVGNFDLFMHSLQPNSWTQYSNAVNRADCKVVQVRWTCTRTLLGTIANTEDIVTAKILMRN